jgi:hypothetical protein
MSCRSTPTSREVVARAGRDARGRNPAGRRRGGHGGQRPVAAGHAERVRTGRRGLTGQRGQILARLQDDGLDPPGARLLGNPGARPCRHPTSG